MPHCLKRRLLYACTQTYQPDMEVHGREVGWIGRPILIRREMPLAHRPIDVALVGRVAEGVVVAFRGTLPPFFGGRHDGWTVLLDWLNDTLSLCVESSDYAGGVHFGFSESMRRLWEDENGTPGVRSAIAMMLQVGAAPHLFITGHSKGGALANLAAFRASKEREWRDLPISVATIAAARTGNAEFAQAYEASRIACLRYEVASDLVPHLPPGPETPGWVHAIARQVWPRLTSLDYRPVGLLVGGGTAQLRHQSWAGSRPRRRIAGLIGRARITLESLSPALLSAHAICPESPYDRLICTGEPCDHGEAPRVSRRRAG